MGRWLVLVGLVGLVACGGPAPTPTPTFARYDVASVVAVLQPLGISNVQPSVRDPQSVAPNTARDQREFSIPSIAPKGGQLLLFATASDLAAMQTWYARFPDLAPYVYVHGNAMLQLNSSLSAAEAARYQAALNSLP